MSIRLQLSLSAQASEHALSGRGSLDRRLAEVLKDCALTEDEVVRRVSESRSVASTAAAYLALHAFRLRGWITHTLVAHGTKWFRFENVTSLLEEHLHRSSIVSLAPFSCMRIVKDEWWLEAPMIRSTAIVASSDAFRIVSELSAPRSMSELSRRIPSASIRRVLPLALRLLVASGLAAIGANSASGRLRQWEFHDLLFHARSRRGFHNHRVGATFRFKDRLPPEAAIKTRPDGPIVRLSRRRHVGMERSFSEVVKDRKSSRHESAATITKDDLAAFLYHVGSITARTRRHAEYDVAPRAYPNAGACYELELYLAVRQCRGVLPGLYYYDPKGHLLVRLSEPTRATDRLLADAAMATQRVSAPQVLITIASRFQRVAWKYESIAYALTLKNVGVLMEMMYLTAAAMGLAACAIGSGDSLRFAEAARIDPLCEGPVGEFALGSL